MSYPILPSLSRAPDFATTRKIEDGTISDPKESGYVSTRPRFTRLRRTWGVTWKNLVAEDIRVLDKFETQTVMGGAGAFYFPSLLPNGSFEFPAVPGAGEVAQCWKMSGSPVWTAGTIAIPTDGTTAVEFTAAGNAVIPSGTDVYGFLTPEGAPIACAVGDQFQYSAMVSIDNFTRPLVAAGMFVNVVFTYKDLSTSSLTQNLGQTPNFAYVPVTGSFTVPAATSGSPAVSMVVSVGVLVSNQTGVPIAADGALLGNMLLDDVRLAQVSAFQPFGKMPGASSPSSAVRFTKPLSIKDTKWAEGASRYDVTCEVTEL